MLAGDDARYRSTLRWWLDELHAGGGELTERVFYRLGDLGSATLHAYKSRWTDFRDWCLVSNRDPARSDTITAYLAYLAGLVDDNGTNAVSYATLEGRVAAIAFAHTAVLRTVHPPTEDPVVRDALGFWAKQLGTAPSRRAKPLTTKLLRRIVEELPPTRAGARDRAMFVVGVAAALRRSELAALELDDLELVDEGLVVHIRRSKTDQVRAGNEIGIPYGANPLTCPVRAHRAWLDNRGEGPGPWLCHIRRGDNLRLPHQRISGNAINDIVQRAAFAAGLLTGYSGHSLRAGFVTSAAEAGLPTWAIMNHARYRSVTVMSGYIRRGSLFIENPAASIGL